MLDRIRSHLERLPAAERKVADWLLRQPHEFVHAAVAAIARGAGVSQPTVIRFARSVGCSGLQELKLKLAASLVAGVPHGQADVAPDDSLAEAAAKSLDNTIAALLRCRNELSANALEQAVRLLSEARRVEFHGLGDSGIVAAAAQHSFLRLDIACVAYADPQMQAMAAALLGPRDVLVAISGSGRSGELLHAAGVASRNGCPVIAVTAPGSPLSRLATLAIVADPRAHAEPYGPLVSRIEHLALIDVLAVGVALRRGPQATAALQRTRRALLRHQRLARQGDRGGAA